MILPPSSSPSNSSGSPPHSTEAIQGRHLLVCQHTTCRQQGAAATWKAFQAALPAGVIAVGCGCLGRCGSGPVILILPEQRWLTAVHPRDVPGILATLAQADASPSTASGSQRYSWAGWLAVGLLILMIIGLLAMGLQIALAR